MKLVTYILGALLAAVLGAAGFYYVTIARPMTAEYQKMKTGMPEFEKAKTDLRKYREAEKKTTAWVVPAIEAAKKELTVEMDAGTAEVQAVDARVIVNLSEQMLYRDGSVTFSKDSVPMLQKLAALLKNPVLNDREIIVGNMTLSVTAHGKGRKNTPARDARALASERSAALVKYLVEKGGVNQEALVAAAYPAALPDRGFKIKDQKTIIIIQTPAMIDMTGQKPAAAVQPKPASTPTGTAATTPQTLPAKPASTPTKTAAPTPQPLPTKPASAPAGTTAAAPKAN